MRRSLYILFTGLLLSTATFAAEECRTASSLQIETLKLNKTETLIAVISDGLREQNYEYSNENQEENEWLRKKIATVTEAILTGKQICIDRAVSADYYLK